MLEIKLVLISEVNFSKLPVNMKTGMLFGGDCYSCCTHAAVATRDGKLIGVATIAPEGEQNSGKPTIVGLYVITEERTKGIGKELMKTAIGWMLENNFYPIQIDSLSSHIPRLIKSLPQEMQEKINLVEHPPMMDYFPE